MTRSAVELALLIAAALVSAAGATWWMRRGQRTPAERERRRRLALNAIGRMTDGFVTETAAGLVCYTYSHGGVEYMASQDISTLGEYLPANPEVLIGPALVKFDQSNPSNSMVVCENWSGLPKRRESA